MSGERDSDRSLGPARAQVAPLTTAGFVAGRHRQRYGLLLMTIASAFAIQGIAQPGRWEQFVVTLLVGATLLLALWIAEARPPVMRAGTVIVAAIVVLSLIEAIAGHVDNRATRLADGLLVAVAPSLIMMGVVRNLRATQAVTLEAVLGVLCVYVLLGMFFAFVYGALDHLGAAPFFAQDVTATTSRCLYFSFTTLATLGYGDLTARSNLGHTLAVSEALIGQIYLVTIVSLIVANLGRRREPR